MKTCEDSQYWHDSVAFLVTEEVALGDVWSQGTISINSDEAWFGHVSKCIPVEVCQYGLNLGWATCWLYNPGQVRQPQFSHL